VAQVKPAGKLAIILVVVGVLFYLVMFGPLSDLIPGRGPAVSIVPKAVALGKIANVRNSVPELPLPSTEPTSIASNNVGFEIMAWNSQFPLMLANGGPSTTAGSLIEKYAKVNVNLIRQDDCEQMKADLLAFAQELSDGNPFPSDKPAFVAIMGDGAAQFLQAINPVLRKLGDDYIAQVVFSTGYSYGEDKLMGPETWKQNPKTMKGSVVAGYLRDGDWNIAMKYAAENGILNNPDETTYDPNAINWVAAKDFIDAAQKCIARVEEERPVVVNGKKTGETRKIRVQGCVTWTPGDVLVAEQLGGLVSVVSTKEYAAQMPQATITIKRFAEENREMLEGIIQAVGEAGDQIKQYPAAIQRAGEVSAEVYKEADRDAEWWIQYFQGVDNFVDKQGMTVSLGGSKPNNLADMYLLFGPAALFKSTYVAFGNVVVQQYPQLVPEYPPAEEAINSSFVLNVVKRTKTTAKTADQFKFDKSASLGSVVGKRKYSIRFSIGGADISPGQTAILESLKDELAISLSLKVVIHGHTDNTGTPSGNQVLSEARAASVKNWLEMTYPDVFPDGRISVVAHGQNAPVADNSTEAGRAQNRRVEIFTGTAR
jgi:OOP family OmpA-OmpF porin